MIYLEGFNEDETSFRFTGQHAMHVARLCGAPWGFEPARQNVTIDVTIFGSPLDTESLHAKITADEDARQQEFFRCEDVDCR